MKADDYRNRPSEEILKEQQELERLRRVALLEHRAWWEWDRESYQFTVSTEWEVLTGYPRDRLFPSDISKSVPFEHLLDNFIDRWMSIVTEDNRAKAKQVAEDFLLMNAKSDTFKLWYELKKADGSTVPVLSEGRSVWADGKLKHLFVSLINIEDWRSHSAYTAAIVADNSNKLQTLDDRLESVKKSSGNLKTLGPLALGLLVIFNDLFESVKPEIVRTWRIFTTPVEAVDVPKPTRFLPDSVSAEDLREAEKILKETIVLPNGNAQIVAYSSGQFPSSYRTIAEVLFGNAPPTNDWETKKVTDSIEAAAQHNAHVSGQAFEAIEPDGSFSYSFPFSINLSSGAVQIFYVRVASKNINYSLIEGIKMDTREAVAAIAPLF